MLLRLRVLALQVESRAGFEVCGIKIRSFCECLLVKPNGFVLFAVSAELDSALHEIGRAARNRGFLGSRLLSNTTRGHQKWKDCAVDTGTHSGLQICVRDYAMIATVALTAGLFTQKQVGCYEDEEQDRDDSIHREESGVQLRKIIGLHQ